MGDGIEPPQLQPGQAPTSGLDTTGIPADHDVARMSGQYATVLPAQSTHRMRRRLAGLVVLACVLASCGDGAEPDAVDSGSTTSDQASFDPADLIPVVADLGESWTQPDIDTDRKPYESVLVRCATGAEVPTIAGLGTYFLTEAGSLAPVALRLGSPDEAAQAVSRVQSKAFTDCLDAEAARDPANLFFADAEYVGSRLGEVTDLTHLVDAGRVDEAVWVRVVVEISQVDGTPDGPINIGVMVVRQGELLQISRFAGGTTASMDSAVDALLEAFPSNP